MKKLITIFAMIVIFNSSYAKAGTLTILDYPGAGGTTIEDISGNIIVGSCYHNHSEGFIYNGTSWSAPYSRDWDTIITGISGNTFVGSYNSVLGSGISGHGFMDNGVTYTTLDYPGTGDTYGNTHVTGIDGGNIVGYYYNHDVSFPPSHGFLYDGTTWTTLDFPESRETWAYDIDGSNIAGSYMDNSQCWHGFIYNGGTWTSFEKPGAINTSITGIYGNNIVGNYVDVTCASHGFFFDGTNWTTLKAPDGTDIFPSGVFENKIFGDYRTVSENTYYDHGFIYEIPEPATLLLLGLGGGLILRKRRM